MRILDWLLRRKPKGRRSASFRGSETEQIKATKAAISTVAAGEGPAAGRFPKLSDASPEVLTQTATSATVAKDGPAPTVNIWDMEDGPGAGQVSAAPAPSADTATDATPRRRSTRTKTRVLGFEMQPASVIPLFDEGRMDDLGESGDKAGMVMYPTGWLVIADGPGRGAAFPVTQGVSQIGRGSDQTVALDFGDMAISRQNHAAVAYDGATHQFHVGHGGKSNLVRLNGKPLLSTEIVVDGDEIQIGETTLVLKVLCTPAFNWSASDAGGTAMMWRSREPRYDVASGISQGARDYQEDAITADFPVGSEAGFVVLADGMGGHAAGDVASKIVLTEVYSELKFHFADVDAFETRAPDILRGVADLANETLRQHTRTHPETEGMGATLVVPALVENRLYWISVGDSPLFLYRAGKLSQLNEDHSMAPQIDFMVKSGLMDPQVGANHPDRNCLISVLMGTRIPKVDCPAKPVELRAGDIVICASDGLQFLTNAQIERVVTKYRGKRSTEIAERLLEELTRMDDPDQDNISFTIIKVNDASTRAREARIPRPSMAVARPKRLTTVVANPMVLPLNIPQIDRIGQPAEVRPVPVAAQPRRALPIEAEAVDVPVRGLHVPDPIRSAPAISVVNPEPVRQDTSPEDLTPVRLRPRRVIVIK